jgi:2-phosphoglycerate kinase
MQKLLLIGGASHVGKSTVAQSISNFVAGSSLGYNYISTDNLARHPGRPWQAISTDIPKHVTEHYQLRSAEQLINDVLDHYRNNVWPSVEDFISSLVMESIAPVAIEGSALLPELVVDLKFDGIGSIWLTGSNDFLKQRIYNSSQYETKSTCERMLIDKFWQRNCLLNNRIIDTVDRFGLVSLDVEDAHTVDKLVSYIDRYLSIKITKDWIYVI